MRASFGSGHFPGDRPINGGSLSHPISKSIAEDRQTAAMDKSRGAC
jgi:hypothetical protein